MSAGLKRRLPESEHIDDVIVPHDPTMALVIDVLTAATRVAGVGKLLQDGMPKHALRLARQLAVGSQPAFGQAHDEQRSLAYRRCFSPTLIHRSREFDRAILDALTAHRQAYSNDESATEQILANWRFAAACGIRLLDEIRHELGRKIDPSFASMIPMISSALVLARDEKFAPAQKLGDAQGSANQRRWRRISCNMQGIITASGKRSRIVVVDISRGGLGLTNAVGFSEGEEVTIQLTAGRQFRGTITWVQGLQAGVKFGQPLSADDPFSKQ